MDKELLELLKQGRKLEAIKKCQEIVGISFSEAKMYIDEIESTIPASELANADAFLIALLKDNRKLEAIKKCQDDNKISFQEAKQHIEKIESTLLQPLSNNPIADSLMGDQTNKIPDNSYEKPQKKRGWVGVAIPIIILLVILKSCSYSTHGGAEMGTVTQFILSIVDTIIPWPDTESTSVYDEAETDYNFNNENSEFSEDTEMYVIEGRIISESDNEFLEGIHIYIKDMGDSGILSDEDGYFKIEISPDVKPILVFKSDDYKIKTVDVSEILLASDGELISVALNEKGIEDYSYE